MSWIQDRLKNRTEAAEAEAPKTAAPQSGTAAPQEHGIERVWTQMLEGFRHDIEEFQRLGRDCDLQQPAAQQCRISNPAANIAVLVTADLSAHTVEYSYESEDERTAVPEGGILTLRPSNHSVDVYSADQRLTNREVRRMILEPVLFPALPTDLAATGT